MKKIFTLILFLITFETYAQSDLHFDKKYIECEDEWVAFKINKDSTYSFGFIYIDAEAGLTLNLEGHFKINNENKYIPNKLDSTSVKIRLEPNNVKVAIIPESRFTELKITKTPDWLHFYKTDTASIERLYKWGFMYNAWGLSSKALIYLEKGQKINPKYPGLEFELAFAYNALEQYEKAILILNEAIKDSPHECYYYKELSFAYLHSNQLEKGVEIAKKGIDICSDKSIKSEIAFNVAYQYYLLKDKENFKYWATIAKKGADRKSQLMDYIKQMEDDLK